MNLKESKGQGIHGRPWKEKKEVGNDLKKIKNK